MNELHNHDCERFEAMMAASLDDDGLSAPDRHALTVHLGVCTACRESFELARQMEHALVSRRADVPAVDSFLPAMQPARTRAAHPRLVGAFRTLMSPAGVAVTLVVWSTMLAFHFRHRIAGVLEWSSAERFAAFLRSITDPLLFVAGGDAYALVAIYVLLTLVVLGSTGLITMKYIRHS